MAEDLGDRTEDPTARRYAEAREKGQVVKSTDLVAAIDWVGVLIMLLLLGGLMVRSMGVVMLEALEDAGGLAAIDLTTITPTLIHAATHAGVALLPFFLVFLIVSVIGHFVQYGALFTTHPLTPDLNKLNPVTGVSRLFSIRTTARTIIGVLKVVLVTIVAAIVLMPELPGIVSLTQLPLVAGLYYTWTLMLKLAAWLIIILLILGVADFFYTKWQLKEDLKMTKNEVKDERKTMDGDPQVRGRRLQMMRSIAMQRMNQAVPKADVIVTNPTHFSVAIRYDSEKMAAPRVVAKGTDFMAMRIRQIAMMHAVPIVERPALARALYYAIDVGGEIPQEQYQAVAEVLAYVYRLEGRAA